MNTAQTLMMALGGATAICAGWGVILLAIVGLASLSNRLCHFVVDSFYGWKTFLEFRKWYAENKDKDNNHE